MIFIINHVKFSRFKTATPDDFWNALQEALKESTDVLEKVEFKTVMVNWLSSSNYPVVKVTRTPKRLGIVRIWQEPFYVQEGDEENNTTLWWIPITYTTQSYCNFSNTLPSVWLTPSLGLEKIIYNIPEDDWIIVNLQQTGEYWPICAFISLYGLRSLDRRPLVKFLVKN